MLKVGLTGSIATGKSTIAAFFIAKGVPVFDSDATVAEIYTCHDFIDMIKAQFPTCIQNGKIDRHLLGQLVFADPQKLAQLEQLLYPKVIEARVNFIEVHAAEPLLVFDVPLLYEKHLEGEMDQVICTYCDDGIQMARALERPHMTAEKLRHILSHQLPQNKKIARADFTIDTGVAELEMQKAFEALHLNLLQL